MEKMRLLSSPGATLVPDLDVLGVFIFPHSFQNLTACERASERSAERVAQILDSSCPKLQQ